MTVRALIVLFLVLLALAAAYVLTSFAALPPLVAAHFDAAGNANGYTSRGVYEVFTLSMLVVLPGLLVAATALMVGVPAGPKSLRLPNAQYWLAPERAPATVAFVAGHTVRFAILLMLFVVYVHRLVMAANLVQPAHLPPSAMATGLAIFLTGTVLWLAALLYRFRQPR